MAERAKHIPNRKCQGQKHQWWKPKASESYQITALCLPLICQRLVLLIQAAVSVKKRQLVTWFKVVSTENETLSQSPRLPAHSTYMCMNTLTPSMCMNMLTPSMSVIAVTQWSVEEGSSLSLCSRFIFWRPASDFMISVRVRETAHKGSSAVN